MYLAIFQLQISDAAFLGRPAAIVGYRCNIRDTGNLETCIVQSPDRRFSTGPRTFDVYIQILDTIILDHLTDTIRRYLSCEGRAFARTTKTRSTRSRPCQCVTLTVRDRYDGVVEGGMNMRNSITDTLLDLFLGTATRFCHFLFLQKRYIKSRLALDRTARTFASPGIGACPLATQWQATPMPDTSVAAEIHQAFDVHGNFPPKITFNGILGHGRANGIDLFFTQLKDLFMGFDAGFSTNVGSAGTSDTINRCQCDHRVLTIRDVDSCYTSHLDSLLSTLSAFLRAETGNDNL
jgi:hypothetical protein